MKSRLDYRMNLSPEYGSYLVRWRAYIHGSSVYGDTIEETIERAIGMWKPEIICVIEEMENRR